MVAFERLANIMEGPPERVDSALLVVDMIVSVIHGCTSVGDFHFFPAFLANVCATVEGTPHADAFPGIDPRLSQGSVTQTARQANQCGMIST